MNFTKIRLRCGGKIPKLLSGAQIKAVLQYKINHASELTGLENDDMIWNLIAMLPVDDSESEEDFSNFNSEMQQKYQLLMQEMNSKGMTGQDLANTKQRLGMQPTTSVGNSLTTTPSPTDPTSSSSSAIGEGLKNAAIQGATALGGLLAADLGGQVSANSFAGTVKGIKNAIATGDAKAGIGAAVAGGVGMAIGALDKGLLEDKNFGAQSEAVDSTVHGVSGALMLSGNIYAMAAGAVLEGVNFLDKAGGQTTPGYNVNIDNSGYSTDMTSMESKSSRTGFFNLMAGNPMLRRQRMQKQLEDRNNKVRMALDAAEISADQQFEQEARMNSISNTIMNNQEALAGGYDTNTLGE